MLFRLDENLEELLVRLLALKPSQTVSSILAAIERLGFKYSSAAVYKELKKLLDQGVLVKIGERYSLSLTWALHYLSLGERIEANYLRRPDLTLALPEKGKAASWRFTSLLRLNDFSSYVVLLLVSQSEDKTVYSWNPHPWFYLAQTTQEAGYIRGLKRSGGRFLKVIGGETALDRWTTRFWRDGSTKFAFAPRFGENRRLYYNVVGDYVASFTVAPEAERLIEELYAKVKSPDEIGLENLNRLFRQSFRCRFKLEHSSRKAGELRKKIGGYFG